MEKVNILAEELKKVSVIINDLDIYLIYINFPLTIQVYIYNEILGWSWPTRGSRTRVACPTLKTPDTACG